ncbi:MAG: hypothetical protein ABW140_02725, partial [Candidatus Sedimenticola sp. 6PFRAG1]
AVTVDVGDVFAFVDDSSVLDAGRNIELSADKSSRIYSIPVIAQFGAAAVGGAVAVNVIAGDTLAYITDSTGYAGSDIVIDADDTSYTFVFSGSFGAGGAAIGGAVSVNVIARTLTAYANNSTLDAGRDVKLSAINASTISNITVSARVGGVSAGAAVAVNVVSAGADAYIRASQAVNAGRDIAITAEDNSTISVIGVSVAIGATAGVGAAITVNTINSNVYAHADTGSALVAGRDITLAADRTTAINNVTAGVQGGVYAGVGGSVGVNVIRGNTLAYISGSSANAGNNIQLTADNTSTVQVVGGSVSLGVMGAAGLSFVWNDIVTTTKAYLDTVTASAGNDIFITADDNSDILSISVNVSAGAGVGLSGAVARNVIGQTVASYINNSSSVTADGNMTIASESTAIIRAVTVGGSGGLIASGAAAVAVNDINNTIRSEITGSTVTAVGDIYLTAESKAPTEAPDSLEGILNDDDFTLVDDYTNDVDPAEHDTSFDWNSNILSMAIKGSFLGVIQGGAAVTTNHIKNTIVAGIRDANVTSTGGDLRLWSDSKAKISALGVGVGGLGLFSAAGTVTVSKIDSTIEAYIGESDVVDATPATGISTVGAANTLEVAATDDSVVTTITINVDGSIAGSVDGAVSDNWISNDVLAHIDNASVVKNAGTLAVSALNVQSTDVLTINVGTGLIFSVGGSVAVSTIDGNTLAFIDGNAQIGTGPGDQVGDVTITARAELDSKAKSYAVNAGAIS